MIRVVSVARFDTGPLRGQMVVVVEPGAARLSRLDVLCDSVGQRFRCKGFANHGPNGPLPMNQIAIVVEPLGPLGDLHIVREEASP